MSSTWSQQTTNALRRAIDNSPKPNGEIADEAGIPPSTFSRRYRGQDPWKLPEIEAVADVLGLELTNPILDVTLPDAS